MVLSGGAKKGTIFAVNLELVGRHFYRLKSVVVRPKLMCRPHPVEFPEKSSVALDRRHDAFTVAGVTFPLKEHDITLANPSPGHAFVSYPERAD